MRADNKYSVQSINLHIRKLLDIMKLLSIIVTASMLLIPWLPALPAPEAENYVSEVWVSDLGDGTYRNPVINADYSDPDVVRVGDDFWMTASSFTNVPGLPILHSRDLVNWTIAGHALKRLVPEDYFNTARHGDGVWAPAIRHHDGEFYIYWGDPDRGVYMVKTKDPAGEWEDPVLVMAAKGVIDTCPLWDDDGKAYLVNGWAKSRSGLNALLTVSEMTPDGKKIIGAPVAVYDGLPDGNHTVEGPKFYKKGGKYYILAPAGGVENGWQIALRSDSPYGPYECRRVMEQGETAINGPHQGGWVDTPSGEDWFLHFQDKGVPGRVVHLNPMDWKDGWPVIGVDKDGDGCGNPVETYRKPTVKGAATVCTPQESDEFDSVVLGPQWQWFANYQLPFGFATPAGYYRLYGQSVENFVNMRQIPNILTQKFPNDTFIATSKVTVSATQAGQESGIIVMGRDYARLSVAYDGKNFVVRMIECVDADKGKPEKATDVTLLSPTRVNGSGSKASADIDLWLRVTVGEGYKCRFSYSEDGEEFHDCGIAFKAREGHWIGARVGFFSIMPEGKNRGWMDIDWFRIGKIN